MIEHHLGKADAALLARLHVRAFPDFFLSQLGEPFLKQFYLGFVDDPTAVIAIARDKAGLPCGVAVGSTQPAGFFSRLLRRRFAGFVRASALAVVRDPRVAPRLVRAITYRGDSPPGLDGALLSSICVDPTYAGQGLGRDLVSAWRLRAFEMGASLAFLTTDAIDNDSVNRFYQRDGWSLHDKYLAGQGRRMNRYTRELLGRSPVEQREPKTALKANDASRVPPIGPTQRIGAESALYRLRDLVAASVGLALAAPLFGAASLAIKLDSPGPVFFRQLRVGKDGRPFRIHKFRSMRVTSGGLEVSTSTDARITRVGGFLRKTKLDELPQLIDVLRGDMSLVGPRPELPRYVDHWPDDLRRLILSVRPGITDPVTVILRHEAEVLAQSDDPESTYIKELLPLKARAYAAYVSERSFLGDLWILMSTFRAILTPESPSDRLTTQRGQAA